MDLINNDNEYLYGQAPRFIYEQKIISDILNWFIDKLNDKALSDRKSPPSFHIKESNKICKELFNYNDDANYNWSCLINLSEKEKVFNIQLSKDNRYLDVEYENAKLTLNTDENNINKYENILRVWFNRPKTPSHVEIWNNLVHEKYQNFEDHGKSLFNTPIKVDGLDSKSIIDGFVCIGNELKTEKTLRKLSSRCFFSDSKFLDNRKKLIKSLYPSLAYNIVNRAVVLNCYIPKNFMEVLFIENQETFIEQINNAPKERVLIYSAGFRATDKLIRSLDGVLFSIVEGYQNKEELLKFKQWWFHETNFEPSCYFWGDLDFSGMSILKQLKKQFSSITAWKEGYQPLLEHLQAGNGHTPEQTNKARQSDPGKTGCSFADNYLLTALRDLNRFVDQEIV